MHRRLLPCLLAIVTGAGCSSPSPTGGRGSEVDAPGEATSSSYREPARLEDGWEACTPEDLGLEREPLERMTGALRADDYPNVHAVLIAKDGRLVYEEYFAGTDRRPRNGRIEDVELAFDRDTLHDVRSVTKSITSALVGIALDRGAISSLDRPLVEAFPEHAALATPETRRITLRHALSMSAGLDWNEREVPYTNPANHEIVMDRLADPAGFVLGRPVVSEPGASWYYNGGLPLLLGLTISRASNRPFGSFAREELFEPLGITTVEWDGPYAWEDVPELAWESDTSWARVSNPAGSLWIRPRDLLKIGQVYAGAGRWNERQVLPEEWVRESLAPHVARGDSLREHGEGVTSHGAYGYLWWHDSYALPYGELTVHAAYGNGGQRIWVVPALGLTAVHLTGNYNVGTSSWNAERLMLERIVPWALGLEATYRHEHGKLTRIVEPGAWPHVTLPPEERERYTGVYDEEGERVEVRDSAGVLEITFPGVSPVALIPEGEHTFATGRVQGGEVRRHYWPRWKVVFVLDETTGEVLRYEGRAAGQVGLVGNRVH